MKYNNSWLSTREVAEILNCSTRNVTNLMKRGKIIGERGEDGNFYFTKSDFFISYPNYIETAEGIIKRPTEDLISEKILRLQELLEDKKKQIDFLMKQLNHFAEERLKMMDVINNQSRLLEFREVKAAEPQEPTRHSFMKRLLAKN